MTLEEWYDVFDKKYCADAHQLVFGCPREKPDENGVLPECQHTHDA
jgi:hypothetical protein